MTEPSTSTSPETVEASAAPDAAFYALPRGYILRMSLFGALGSMLFRSTWRPADAPGRHGGIIYVEIAGDHLAFFEGKQGALRRRPGRLLARHPLAAVRSWNLKKGFLTSSLEVAAGDDAFRLVVQRNQRKQAEAATQLMASRLPAPAALS